MIEEIRAHALARPGVTEEFPFGPDALVLKVLGKVFAIIALDPPHAVSLKCDPEVALELRERWPSVRPGYHLNKRHWNTVTLDGLVPRAELLGWVDDSWTLVVATLRKAEREALAGR